LIAEDSATQAHHLQHILERHGYQVTAAANGRLALEATERHKPALIISDVVMPEMNGYELCTRIKADPRLSDSPVILVTTLSDPQEVIRGLECGADNFILKPYNADLLLQRIQFVLINNQMRRTHQPGMGLEIVFNGQQYFITADRLQILNLLLSTYEAAIQRNRELSTTRDALRKTNLELRQLTNELEDRVLRRTRELERSNEALRQAQQTLIQQERLHALGQMASGIAHDINNAISPIALYTESLIKRETTLSDAARDSLVIIQRAIDDVAQTVARMREFYRPREVELPLTDVELNSLVQQVIDLTRARWSDQPQRSGIKIELQTGLTSDLPNIRGAENEIRDALTNLIFNAVDAMPTGGRIEVRTSTLPARAQDGSSEQQVQVEVSDSGIGMDEQTRRRCLEPFFTTKGERGTGLGLAMVYGMAQRHGAVLEIDSKQGAGTTMRLRFPIGTSTSTPTTQPAAAQVPTRSLRILLVDDNLVILKAVRSALEQDGHAVTTTDGGQRGIETFRAAIEAATPFDVVLTDLGMPHVDGRMVAAAIKSMAPDVPVILLTGWEHGLRADDKSPPHVDRVLGKPPKLAALRVVLAELTNRPTGAQDSDRAAEILAMSFNAR